MSVEMGISSRGDVVARDFVGLIDNVDQRDLPPGAADDQVNICCIVLGELSVRLGYREILFDAIV